MQAKAAIRDEASRLLALFEASGAVRVEADILQPAGILLDLYGEDIRARAFVIHDPLAGEQMLRPDFTVPVVQMHMAHGAEPARYCYAGEVFRRQEKDTSRPSEYMQVGYEVFDREDAARADAEVFSLISSALNGVPLRAVTGDIGILTAAVRGLKTSDRRKAALMRHLWRPARFRALLNRFAGLVPVPTARAELLALADPMSGAGPVIGLRDAGEVAERIEALRQEAAEPPIPALEFGLLNELLVISDKAPAALARLRALANDMPSIAAAVDRMAARLERLGAAGIDAGMLDFETTYGRTSMEYYDGFVFGFYSDHHPDLPPVATGGRYDALTERLGPKGAIPAVGAVIRPELVLATSRGRS